MPDVADQGDRSLPAFRRQLFFWLAALAGLLVLLRVFSSILLPFVAGAAVAYLLDPVADWMERRGLSRTAVALILLLLFFALFVVALIVLIPALVDQLVALVDHLPDLIAQLQAFLDPLLESDLARFFGIDRAVLEGQLGDFVGGGAAHLSVVLGSIWSGGKALIAVLSLLVVTPVVAFYFLHDWNKMVSRIDSWLPHQHAETIRDLARQMNRAIAGFVRGQGLLCVILSIFYAGALGLIGLDFGLLIGLVAGALSFIPLVGALVGFIVSVGVAAVQFWPEGLWIAVTAGVFIVGQLLESYVLQPRIIGNSIGLHPVWMLFAFLAFGVLFGFVGTLIAIPAAAVVAVLVRFGLGRYLASPFHGGGPAIGLSDEGSAGGAKE